MKINPSMTLKDYHFQTSLAYKTRRKNRKVEEFLFLNQDSLLIGNEDFKGKVYVAEFFFTRCPSICIEMNKNMKILDELYGEREDFGIASFTIDPENDTPTALKKYSELIDVKSKNWHFLTGDIDEIYALSNKGFNMFSSINEKVAGGFEHQGFFALVDQNGYIRSRLNVMAHLLCIILVLVMKMRVFKELK